MNWLETFFGAPFNLLGWVMRTYGANRARVAALLAGGWVRGMYRGAVVLTMLAWLVIWLFGDGEYRDRLSETIKQMIGTEGRK